MRRGADVALGAALFGGAALFVFSWPRDLVPLDEGLFVYEAQRILAGDVPYRDFFEIVTPGAWYMLALLYRVFGVDFATARGMMAVIHGSIVLAIYAACRRLDVRPGLSAGAALFHLAAGFPTMTFATPHWVSTLVTLAALHVAIGMRRITARGAFALGVVGACAIAVQQQKGVWLLVGLAVYLVLCGGWQSGRVIDRRAMSSLFALVAGALLVLLPMAMYLFAAAGAGPLYAALLEFPLTSYRTFHSGMDWGISNPLLPSYQPFPRFMSWQPLVLPVLAVRAYFGWRDGDGDAVRRGLLLAVFFAFSVLGIAYNPGYTHLALIAPLSSIAAVEIGEWGLRRAVLRSWARALGWVAAGAVAALSLMQMRESRRVRQRMYWARAETRFGAIDFMSAAEREQLAALTERMRGERADDLFVYPHHAAVYLITGTRNPTRFQVMLPSYNPPEQFEEVIGVLDAKKVKYILVMGGIDPGDRAAFWKYVLSHYRRVPLGKSKALRSPLFERIATGAAAAEAAVPARPEAQ